MTKIVWDAIGERLYETGVDHGVLYLANEAGEYNVGYGWNGLVGVSESPSGAEATPQYADNIKYLNLVSAEEFGATIECFTYPDAFEQCNGVKKPSAGVSVAQQTRRSFGFSYRSLIGNDLVGTDYGYKINLVYGALATPSEKARTTVNESPEAMTLSYEITTTSVPVGDGYRPTAFISIDSTKESSEDIATLEQILYGTEGVDPRLPLPAEVIEIFGDGLTVVTATAPTFDDVDDEITIPVVTGVTYRINGLPVTGVIEITGPTFVKATPDFGYVLSVNSDDDWAFSPS